MTVKELIHKLVDELPAADAERMLDYLRSIADGRNAGAVPFGSTTKSDDADEWLKLGRPTAEDDPLWNLTGIIDDNGPTDVSSNLDAYLADAYLDWEKR
ncbi:MAG: hypothetical protein IT336_16100 [Thermomicrobiales bacterium]|nr:hypothetical protein [Thermomicrobiales bacterium]